MYVKREGFIYYEIVPLQFDSQRTDSDPFLVADQRITNFDIHWHSGGDLNLHCTHYLFRTRIVLNNKRHGDHYSAFALGT
ncbi:unnamed protein product [Urochloa humidicola]